MDIEPALNPVCSDLSSWPIFIVGATGWIGRSILHELQLRLPRDEFFDRVTAFASVEKTILSTGFEINSPINVRPLSALKDLCSGRQVLVLHAAFLTKDRIDDYGLQAFCEINSSISSLVHESLLAATASRVLLFSSGAASALDHVHNESLITTVEPYGYLKRKEEALLSSVLTAEVQVFRVYALTGFFIRTPSRFAVGSFLQAALEGGPVIVRSNAPVIRGYVSAADLSACSISWLLSGKHSLRTLAAVTDVVTLVHLAEQISKIWTLPPPIIPEFVGSPSAYSASPAAFMGLLDQFAIKRTPLPLQLCETASGISGRWLD